MNHRFKRMFSKSRLMSRYYNIIRFKIHFNLFFFTTNSYIFLNLNLSNFSNSQIFSKEKERKRERCVCVLHACNCMKIIEILFPSLFRELTLLPTFQSYLFFLLTLFFQLYCMKFSAFQWQESGVRGLHPPRRSALVVLLSRFLLLSQTRHIAICVLLIVLVQKKEENILLKRETATFTKLSSYASYPVDVKRSLGVLKKDEEIWHLPRKND